MSEITKFRLWLAACAGSGVFLTTHEWDKSHLLVAFPHLGHLLSNVLPKIGEALIIAPILAVIVDAAAKRQLLAEFARDVSIHIVGRLLPQHLREHMLTYLNANIVRKNWNLTFTITEWPEHPDFVQLTTVSEYEIENCEKASKNYDFFYEVENSWFPSVAEGRLLHVCVSVAGQKITDERDAALHNKMTVEQDCRLYKQSVMIPGCPHPTYRFLTESVECFRDGIVPFVAPVAVLGTTVTVYYPKEECRVGMYVSSRPGAQTLERTELANGTQWHIREPLLPGQCIFTRWQRVTKDLTAIPQRMQDGEKTATTHGG